MKWYGNLDNRLEEGRGLDAHIEVGTLITEYMYSDRHPYEVVEVKDQKHIAIRKLDHKNIGTDFSNEWELISNDENPVYNLTKRGKYWYFTTTWTREDLFDIEENIGKRIALGMNGITIEELQERGKITRYHKANISIGKAEYYCDYEF